MRSSGILKVLVRFERVNNPQDLSVKACESCIAVRDTLPRPMYDNFINNNKYVEGKTRWFTKSLSSFDLLVVLYRYSAIGGLRGQVLGPRRSLGQPLGSRRALGSLPWHHNYLTNHLTK